MTQTRFAIGKRRRVALVAGGTGLVGRELVEALLADNLVGAVHVLVRNKNAELAKRSGLTQHVVDYTQRLTGLPPVDDAFCCLGTTIKVAGSQAAFRAVDFDAALAFARAARECGATRLGVVSALGADASSSVFYNRVKGELEDAILSLGYRSVTIARPSLLLGDRAEHRRGEEIAKRFAWLTPSRYKPIQAATVARALTEAAREDAPGVRIVESRTMRERWER
jgi:uncharacterized protein YbjT (DUF2867 family)